MSKLKLNTTGGSGGSVALKGPASTTDNADVELTLPVDDGTSSQYLQTNGSGVLSWSTVATPTARTQPFRNLVINGAMNVAQRGTSSTSTVYRTVDRWMGLWGGTDEDCTQAQVTLTSSDTGPWAKGFRKAFQITNGNQTSGAGANDYVELSTILEGQDVAPSGWDYTSTSGKVTLSFWVKSSVAQNFYGRLRSLDGTDQNYTFETGSLSANTWTKITKTIPGAAAIQINNGNSPGLEITIVPFQGTDRTASMSLDTWAAYSSSSKSPDMTSTWYTTNDSTFAITGVQLEVGDTATEFEHMTYNEELRRCQRYCYMVQTNSSGEPTGIVGYLPNTSVVYYPVIFPVPLKGGPTFSIDGTWKHVSYDDSDNATSGLIQDVYNANPTDNSVTASRLKFTVGSLGSAGTAGMLQGMGTAWLKWEAEL